MFFEYYYKTSLMQDMFCVAPLGTLGSCGAQFIDPPGHLVSAPMPSVDLLTELRRNSGSNYFGFGSSLFEVAPKTRQPSWPS